MPRVRRRGESGAATTDKGREHPEATMNDRVDRASILTLFEGIQSAFPNLHMHVQGEHPHVDLMLDIPRQPGLVFPVNLNLQGDELHLSAGPFWLEWFPCTDSEVVARYRQAVVGLLSGEYRILEHLVGKRTVKAQLQRPDGEKWETIGTSFGIGGVLPWRRSTRVLQNLGS